MRYSKSFCRVYLKAHASAVMARSSCSRVANICTKSTCPLYPCQTENQNCNMQTQMHRCDLNSVSHLEIGTCDCNPPPPQHYPQCCSKSMPNLCRSLVERSHGWVTCLHLWCTAILHSLIFTQAFLKVQNLHPITNSTIQQKQKDRSYM